MAKELVIEPAADAVNTERFRPSVKQIVIFIVAIVCFFAAIEGLSSTILLLANLETDFVKSLKYTRAEQYDQELGWVAIPQFYEQSMYAPLVYLKTNSQGFRNSQDFSAQVPPHMHRLVCLGDSFTFGYGVDNDHTWCQLLAAMDHSLQTVNMGQVGYGVDQDYLWYLRNERLFQHNINIFAVVTDDFRRMQSKQFIGHEKPVLRIRGGKLVVDNVPVPQHSLRFRAAMWFARNRESIEQLRTIQLFNRLIAKFSSQKKPEGAANNVDPVQQTIVAKILESMQSAEAHNGSTLILVYLPSEEDRRPNPSTLAWRQFLQEETARRKVLFFDLVPAVQQLPWNRSARLFLWPGDAPFASATAGHYSNAGNEWVANEIYKRLSSLDKH